VTRALDQITSDIRRYMPGDARDAGDLALWTGRLAHADQEWNLAERAPPKAPRARAASELAPGPEDVRAVVAAVHHTADAVAQLGDAHQRLAFSAAKAKRFLVPTQSLSARYDVPRPYALAPRERIEVVLGAYRQAREASIEAGAHVAQVAKTVGSPSRALTLARQVNSGAGVSLNGRQVSVGGIAADVTMTDPPQAPGPVERSLQVLGVVDPEQLRRAVEIIRAGEQLLIDASSGLRSGADRRAELDAAVREIPQYSRVGGVRGGIPVRQFPMPVRREASDRQAE
jgi:hypothetical protein